MSKEFNQELLENLVSKICHDISAPLTTNLGGVELIKNKINANANIESLLQIVDESAQQMTSQINITRYLYSIGRRHHEIFIQRFLDDWQQYFAAHELQVKFKNGLREINTLYIQIIAHVIILFEEFFNKQNVLEIELNEPLLILSFEIDQEIKNTSNEIAKIASHLCQSMWNEDVNPMNVNLHFLRNLLNANSCRFFYKSTEHEWNKQFIIRFNTSK